MSIVLFIDQVKEYFIFFLKLLTFFLFFYQFINNHIKLLVIFVARVICVKRLICFKKTSFHIDLWFIKICKCAFCKIFLSFLDFSTSACFIINMDWANFIFFKHFDRIISKWGDWERIIQWSLFFYIRVSGKCLHLSYSFFW